MSTVGANLVVVIPGIGGSELGDSEGIAWGDGMRSLVSLLLDPSRLALERQLQPMGLLRSFAIVPFWKNVAGYDRLWAGLHQRLRPAASDLGRPESRNLGAQLVAFPYDFRLGVTDAADRLERDLDERLHYLREQGGDPRVVIVAHSMGGLIARDWASRPGRSALCKGILTIGTPYRGAPKAVDVLVNGLRLGPFRRGAVDRVVQAWPGLHHLVATDPVILCDHEPGHSHGTATTAWWAAPHQITSLPRGHQIRASKDYHDDVVSRWTELRSNGNRPPLRILLGTGHATLESLTWDGTTLRAARRIGHPSHRSSGSPDDDMLCGDATVPYRSSSPPDSPDTHLVADSRGERHGHLQDAELVPRIVEDLLRPEVPSVVRGRAGDELALGLDAPELLEVGDDIALHLLVSGHGTPPSHATAHQTWHPLDGDPIRLPSITTSLREGSDGPAAEVQLPMDAPQGAGGVLEVQVEALSPDRTLVCRELIGVMG